MCLVAYFHNCNTHGVYCPGTISPLPRWLLYSLLSLQGPSGAKGARGDKGDEGKKVLHYNYLYDYEGLGLYDTV